MKYPQIGKFALDFKSNAQFRLRSYQDVFSDESYLVLQNAFEKVPWVRKETSFYEQYESFVQPNDQHALACLYDPSFFFPFKEKLEAQLGIQFQNRIRLAAHKLIQADAIGLHNDYTQPELGHENYRFIFQFSKNEPVVGGELSFWKSKYTKEILQKFPYQRNYGVCFEITPNSYHSVEPVLGERYTIVMYLWEKGRPHNGLGFVVH
ncbi:MAG TPA: 2OG-Fe(II) oxygenase [Chlamydiales bacterium]|nr:2OG-Fe(II) oxygenase [Chlamydiales bacterium]